MGSQVRRDGVSGANLMVAAMTSVNLPRERRGVLRPFAERQSLEPTGIWWVVDDLGAFDGPHESLEAAWDRIEDIYDILGATF
jgi:hypothetical protein